MSLEFQVLSGLLFILGGVLGVMLIVMPLRAKTRGTGSSGVVAVGKHKYPYEMGDQILRSGGSSSFSGIDVLLPKRLPHIFVDAYGNNDGSRAEFVLESDHKVALEGDFGRIFQAYTPKQYKALALNILTADVMQILMKYSHRLDLETMGYHVRLMAPNQLVSHNPQTQKALLEAAKVVMREVDHQLKSWDKSQLISNADKRT
jgi:hypothetical protein